MRPHRTSALLIGSHHNQNGSSRTPHPNALLPQARWGADCPRLRQKIGRYDKSERIRCGFHPHGQSMLNARFQLVRNMEEPCIRIKHPGVLPWDPEAARHSLDSAGCYFRFMPGGSSVNQSSPEIGHEDNRSRQSYARRVMERTAEECRRSFRVWPHNFRSTSSSS